MPKHVSAERTFPGDFIAPITLIDQINLDSLSGDVAIKARLFPRSKGVEDTPCARRNDEHLRARLTEGMELIANRWG